MAETTPKTNTPPVAPPKEKEELKIPDGQVLVSQETLQRVLEELSETKKKVQDLEATAPQDQIKKIEALRAEGKLIKAVKINVYEGKYVVGWRSTADDVWVDNNSKEHRLQKTEVVFADGKKSEMDQLEFARRKTFKELEVIKEGKDKIGDVIFTCLDSDGKEIEINSRFVN